MSDCRKARCNTRSLLVRVMEANQAALSLSLAEKKSVAPTNCGMLVFRSLCSLKNCQLICILILLLGRVANAIMPFALGELIRIFEHRSDNSPWLILGGYVVLRFLQSSGGLAALRDVSLRIWIPFLLQLTSNQTLWAPVMQYSDRG